MDDVYQREDTGDEYRDAKRMLALKNGGYALGMAVTGTGHFKVGTAIFGATVLGSIGVGWNAYRSSQDDGEQDVAYEPAEMDEVDTAEELDEFVTFLYDHAEGEKQEELQERYPAFFE